jgi:hypothetical protein
VALQLQRANSRMSWNAAVQYVLETRQELVHQLLAIKGTNAYTYLQADYQLVVFVCFSTNESFSLASSLLAIHCKVWSHVGIGTLTVGVPARGEALLICLLLECVPGFALVVFAIA